MVAKYTYIYVRTYLQEFNFFIPLAPLGPETPVSPFFPIRTIFLKFIAFMHVYTYVHVR